MQQDFHYYCIAVLARAAGFNKTDALDIAYASQYVDDSEDGECIQVGPILFKPVRTAHFGPEVCTLSAQNQVYIPFHFIPPKAKSSTDDRYVTRANSSFGLRLLREAYKETHNLPRMIRIGVALHSYADTWAHQGFSGRNRKENDVKNIFHKDKKSGSYLSAGNIYTHIPFKIGHVRAGHCPDHPSLTWKYTGRTMNKGKLVAMVVERNNTREFLTAARTIYLELRKVSKVKGCRPMPWKRIKDGIGILLAEHCDAQKRCKKWKRDFQPLFDKGTFSYVKRKWQREAGVIHGVYVKRDNRPRAPRTRLKYPMKKGFDESRWVYFHRAASQQRDFVVQKIAQSLR